MPVAPLPVFPVEPFDPIALEERIQERVRKSLLDMLPHLEVIPEFLEWFGQDQLDFAFPKIPDNVQRVVRPEGRPAIVVQADHPVVPSGNAWEEDLNHVHLLPAIQATGRISLLNESQSCRGMVGTGWLVAEGIVVTNRHVAKCFAFGNQPPFRFRPDLSLFDVVRVEIDFKAEQGSAGALTFPVAEVLDIAADDGPDLAFLRLGNPQQLPMPSPVTFATDPQRPQVELMIAAIGYPGKPAGDLKQGEMEVIEAIFTGYGIKTLSPGKITALQQNDIFIHDCSTLKGNSGSIIVDLADGTALGIHFEGEFLTGNRALTFSAINHRMQALGL